MSQELYTDRLLQQLENNWHHLVTHLQACKNQHLSEFLQKEGMVNLELTRDNLQTYYGLLIQYFLSTSPNQVLAYYLEEGRVTEGTIQEVTYLVEQLTANHNELVTANRDQRKDQNLIAQKELIMALRETALEFLRLERGTYSMEIARDNPILKAEDLENESSFDLRHVGLLLIALVLILLYSQSGAL